MIVYRIDADAAFDLLKWRSQAANIKLRVLANSSWPIFGHSTTTTPCPTPSVRPTTANRPQPCPAVMCDRETVDANTVGEFGRWTATIVKERYMIEYDLDTEHSILHVQPKSAIEQDDFVNLAKAVDPHIEATGGLAGLIVETPVVPRMEEFWGNGQPVSLCSRSSQAHQENRSRNELPPGRCRRASNVTLCESGDQAFPRWADRGSKTMDHERLVMRRRAATTATARSTA